MRLLVVAAKPLLEVGAAVDRAGRDIENVGTIAAGRAVAGAAADGVSGEARLVDTTMGNDAASLAAERGHRERHEAHEVPLPEEEPAGC